MAEAASNMKMLRGCLSLLLFVAAFCLQVHGQQYPGQYPPGQSPGQYPPGQGPQGGRSPFPRIPGQTDPNGRPRAGQPQPDSRGKRSSTDAKGLLTTTAGILRRAA